MKNIYRNIRTSLCSAALATALTALANSPAAAGSHPDTLIAGERGSITLTAEAPGAGATTLQVKHTFRGLAVIHLSLRATDALGRATLAELNVRGYSSSTLSDDACTLPAGTQVEGLSTTIQYDAWGEHYQLTATGDQLALSKGGKDYTYASRYELRPIHLTVPAAPESPLVPAAQPAGATVTIR